MKIPRKIGARLQPRKPGGHCQRSCDTWWWKVLGHSAKIMGKPSRSSNSSLKFPIFLQDNHGKPPKSSGLKSFSPSFAIFSWLFDDFDGSKLGFMTKLEDHTQVLVILLLTQLVTSSPPTSSPLESPNGWHSVPFGQSDLGLQLNMIPYIRCCSAAQQPLAFQRWITKLYHED